MKSIPVVKSIAAGLMVAALLALTGCNTVEGVGKDVKAGGRAVEKAAVESKPN